jgi:hypothetical protein
MSLSLISPSFLSPSCPLIPSLPIFLHRGQRARTIRAACTIASSRPFDSNNNNNNSNNNSASRAISNIHNNGNSNNNSNNNNNNNNNNNISDNIDSNSSSSSSGINIKESTYNSVNEALLLNTTHTDQTLDLVDLTVRSLSHVRLLTGTLRAVLWEACGGDQEKVRDAVYYFLCCILFYCTVLYYTLIVVYVLHVYCTVLYLYCTVSVLYFTLIV